MQRRSLWVLVVFVLAWLGAIVWWLGRDSAADSTASHAAEIAATAPAHHEAAPKPDVTAPKPAESHVASERSEVTNTAKVAAPLAEADAVWFSGRVAFPEGTPLDEEIAISCIADSAKDASTRVVVASDGKFRVGAPKSAKKARLKFEAHYAFLDSLPKLDLAKPRADLLLEPKLGGRIVGHFDPPANAAPEDRRVAGIRVGLTGIRKLTNGSVASGIGNRSADVDQLGNFEFGGVDASFTYNVSSQPDTFVAYGVEDLHVQAGVRQELAHVFVLGGSLSGKVIDERGAAIVAANVQLVREWHQGDAWSWRSALTDANGEFRMRGIPVGKCSLKSTRNGLVEGSSDELNLKDGDDLRGLVINMQRGHSVAGVVRWPDGKPAAGANVNAHHHAPSADASQVWQDENGEGSSVRADDQGHFEISGLERGPFRVRAQALERRDAGPAAVEASARSAASATASSSPRKRLTWRCELDGVDEDAASLELVLQAPVSIVGRTVDDTGAPVKRFDISAVRMEGTTEVYRERVSQHFNADDGAFSFERLHPGTWKVTADSAGASQSDVRLVTVPGNTEELTFVCPRDCELSGVVRDPHGAPLEGAAVEAEVVGLERSFRVNFNSPGSANTSDVHGAFHLANVHAGVVRVTASKTGFASSERQSIELAPGASRSDLVLAVRAAGRIEVQLDATLLAESDDWSVWLNDVQESGWHQPELVGSRYVFADLAPGRYVVSGWSSKASEQRQQPRATIDVSAGETAHVVLGGASRNAVALSGKVTSGGKPVARVRVQASSEGVPYPSTVSAETDDSGRYAVTLDEPGAKTLVYESPGGSSLVDHVMVPEAKSFVHDVELPSRRISGHVFGAEQKPLGNLSVELAPEATDGAPASRVGYGHATTNADGEYTFDYVAPGKYRVSAGGEPPYGRRTLHGLDVASQEVVAGADLYLSGAARIQCTLHRSGSASGRGMCRVRDASGETVQSASVDSAADGAQFTCEGLAAGTYVLDVFAGAVVSSHPVSVTLADGDVKHIDFDLVAGATLLVTLDDVDGKSLAPNVTVLDSRGWNAEPYMYPGLTSNERTIQPLAPGTYKVIANDHAGHSATQTIEIGAGESHTLPLKLDH